VCSSGSEVPARAASAKAYDRTLAALAADPPRAARAIAALFRREESEDADDGAVLLSRALIGALPLLAELPPPPRAEDEDEDDA
jgi:hypothetical protein